jgi:hypothetical protein
MKKPSANSALHSLRSAIGLQNIPSGRFMAGDARFFTLSQSLDRPARYGRSLCFETMPPRPIRQACRNRSGRSSPVRSH